MPSLFPALSHLRYLKLKVTTPYAAAAIFQPRESAQIPLVRACFSQITSLVLLALECHIKGWAFANYQALNVHVDGEFREQRWAQDDDPYVRRYDFTDLRKAAEGKHP